MSDFGAFTITHVVDKSTPALNYLCAAGQVIPTIEIEMYLTLEGHKPFMKYTLNNVTIVRVSPVSSNEVKPTEEVEFAYDEIRWTYMSYKEDGSKEAEYVSGWNLSANRKTDGN